MLRVDKKSYLPILLMAGALLVSPLVLERDPNFRFIVRMMFWTLLYVSLGMSWNIIGGYAGQLSFGHAAFYGIGSYTVILLALQGTNPLLVLPLAGIFAALLGLSIGYPTFKLRGPFFSIATLGIGETMRILANNIEEVFKGGSSGISMPLIQGWTVYHSHYLILGVAFITLAVSHQVRTSKFGLNLYAIRDDEDAAETLGVDVTRNKLLALMVSAFLVGVAGGAEAIHVSYIFPDDAFSLKLSVAMVLITLIGGIGTYAGPVIGAIFFTVIDQFFMVSFPYLHLLLYGGLLVLILIFEPDGVMGLWGRMVKRAGLASSR